MRSRRILLASVLISSLLAAGCLKEAVKSLGSLQRLQVELTKKFGENVNVNLHQGAESVLQVTFINSALNGKTKDDRVERAKQTARFVKEKYDRMQNVGTLWVGFVRQETHFVVFHETEDIDFFPFTKDAQPLITRTVTEERTPEISPSDVRVDPNSLAVYSPSRNESDIAAGVVQLEGQAGKGLTLLPHYKVPGDANQEPGNPPKVVSFDFASYSLKFDETVPVSFIADGKPVVQTKGTFTGNEAQFCYLTVPYPVFKRMIAANELVIKLGDRPYQVSPRQFAMLKKMGEYVKQ